MTDTTPSPPATSTDALMLRVAALKVISDYTKGQYEAARTEAAAVLGAGDRRMVRSPLDSAKIGPVYVTDPKPIAVVTDTERLTAWYLENYPDSTVNAYEVAASNAEVIGVLFEHAPRLLRHRRQITPQALSELRKESAALGQVIGPGGEADVPGIEVRVPQGVVTCRPAEDALHAVTELILTQRLTLDGTLRELPAGSGNE